MPSSCRPATKPGPAEMPTTAMKTFRPTEFMNQTVEGGMRPKVGWIERSQPKTRPEMSVPPAVDSVSGTLPTMKTSAPTSAPSAIAPPMKATSATVLGTIGIADILGGRGDVLGATDHVRMSPRWICRLRQDRDVGGGGAARDLAQEDAARLRPFGRLRPASGRRSSCWSHRRRRLPWRRRAVRASSTSSAVLADDVDQHFAPRRRARRCRRP